MARYAMGKRQETAKEVDMQPSPAPDLHEVLGAGDGAAEHHKQYLRQREDNLPPLTRIAQRSKVVEKGRADG